MENGPFRFQWAHEADTSESFFGVAFLVHNNDPSGPQQTHLPRGRSLPAFEVEPYHFHEASTCGWNVTVGTRCVLSANLLPVRTATANQNTAGDCHMARVLGLEEVSSSLKSALGSTLRVYDEVRSVF